MTAPMRPTEEALRSLSVVALVDAILELQAIVDDLVARTGMCEERERHMLLARRRKNPPRPPIRT